MLVNYLRPSPVFDGDQLKGYQVYPGNRGGIFAQMGLQGGDVVLALDDQPFGDPQQAIEAFKQLTTGAALVATVERGGKIERISIDGRLIVADQQRAQSVQAALPPSAN